MTAPRNNVIERMVCKARSSVFDDISELNKFKIFLMFSVTKKEFPNSFFEGTGKRVIIGDVSY